VVSSGNRTQQNSHGKAITVSIVIPCCNEKETPEEIADEWVRRLSVPLRSLVEMRCEQVFGSPPLASEHGKLAVITNR
jgi:hypothetical protein